MINWNQTNLLWTQSRPILNASVSLMTEGMGLVGAFEAGTNKCTMGTGSTSDTFLGIAMGPRKTFSTNVKLETVTVPAVSPYTVLLTHTVSAAPGTYVAAGSLVASSGSAASTTNVQYTTDATTGLTLLTFDPSFAGQTFTVAYSYVMGTTEEQGLYGNPNPGFPPEQILSQTEMFKLGQVSLNNFSPTANWYAGGGMPNVKLVAGGLWTDAANAATGIIPSNVRVISIPTTANPWLTMELQ